MAPSAYPPDLSASRDPVLAERLLESGWRPGSTDPGAALPALVPVLDRVRGPVTRLLLSVGGWTSRPHEITTEGRTVTIGYLAGQSPSMLTALCADGATFTVRVTPPEPSGPPGAPRSRGDDEARHSRSHH